MLLSIVIPFYNSSKTIKKCLDSILFHAEDFYEIICIDDGSFDSSSDIVKKYSLKYDKIKYYRLEKNQGVSNARNFGITKATGDYLYFVDSDDEIKKDGLSKIKTILLNNKPELLIFNVKKDSKLVRCKKLDSKVMIGKIINNKKIMGYLWNKVFSLSIIKENNIRFNNNISIGEDMLFALSYIKYSKNNIYVNQAFYTYYIGHGVTSSIDSHYKLIDTYKLMLNDIKDKSLINIIKTKIIMHQIIILKKDQYLFDDLKKIGVIKLLFRPHLKLKYKIFYIFKCGGIV